jgi:uncharacterized protein YjiS (DUF1127 family)
MNTIFRALAGALPMVTQSLGIRLERWWVEYLTWRLERVAVAQLWSLSDRALKDIGFTRTEITSVVTDDATRKRRFAGVGR